MKRIFFALGLALIIGAVALASMQAGRVAYRQGADSLPSGQQVDPTDTPLETTAHISRHYARESHAILMSDLIVHGVVTDVSTSCWNNPSCTYSNPTEDWVSGTLNSSYMPMRYFTVTFAISDTWYDDIGVSSPITITSLGDSPEDPTPTRQPHEVVFTQNEMTDWNLGDEMVLMLKDEPWVTGAMTVSSLSAPWAWQYHVSVTGTLSNPASGVVTRSTTITDLQVHVDNLLDP